MPSSVKVAVVGCSHGQLDNVYASLEYIQKNHGQKVDLLVCCGDFQAVRNGADLECMAVPPRYRCMETFHKYYSGACVAPVLTLFIGGNHEACNYLAELPYGGWVAHNIYYIGYAGAVRFRGLRIAGLLGVYSARHYDLNHFECPPYCHKTIKSVYHTRSVDVFRLKQLKHSANGNGSRLDMCLSHGWPCGIHDYGNQQELFRRKLHLIDNAVRCELGCPATMLLLKELRPRYWFSAHLHIKFAAIVQHSDETNTRFLALDECLPGPHRQWLQILDIPAHGQWDQAYDAILRNTNHLTKIENEVQCMPTHRRPEGWRYDFRPTKEEMDAVLKILDGDWSIPLNFEPTGPPHVEGVDVEGPMYFRNPQTASFCQRFAIKDMNEMFATRYEECTEIAAQNVPVPQKSLFDGFWSEAGDTRNKSRQE